MVHELQHYKLARATALSLSSDPVYVLLFASQEKCRTDYGLFAVAVSEKNEIKLYNEESFCTYGLLQGHNGTITGLAFCPSNAHLIWSSSLDATVRCWETRSGKQGELYQLKGDASESFSAMDLSCDGKYLCVGTEQINEEDVFLYVWNIEDFPEVKLHAKYEDLHSDDITQVKCHPTRPEIMATGSTDGLVSISDLNFISDDDALLQTLNTESSVSSIGYFGPSYEFLCSITHIETVQFWDYLQGDQLGCVSDVRQSNEAQVNVDYITGSFFDETSGRLFLVGGTFSGGMVILHANLGHLDHFQSLHLCHSSTLRCVQYSSRKRKLLVGGEDGMISMWTEEIQNVMEDKETKETGKMSKQKEAKRLPYKKGRHPNDDKR